jgi:hypothetical protein
VALWASVNLLWVGFDLTYVPLRTFWLQRTLYPFPSLPLALPLTLLPSITPYYDPIKGIEPHRQTQAYLAAFRQLDQQLLRDPAAPAAQVLRRRQLALTDQIIDENPFLVSGQSGSLETVKNRLRQRAGLDSAKLSNARLLSEDWLQRHPWQGERRFWQQQVLPLIETCYWRSIDENGHPTDHFWWYDLVLFQGIFVLDIGLRVLRLRRRLPGLSWRDALLRRWIDLPLLLPIWRWSRLLPVVERLSGAGLINIEPLRAVVSRAVVSLLALELFEVLALQLVDGTQSLIRSPQWPRWIRNLRSHQRANLADGGDLVELLRLWGPMVLGQVAPRLSPELQAVLSHALQQSFRGGAMGAQLSSQLSAAVVDSLLDLSRSTGKRLSQPDNRQVELLLRFADRFLDELGGALEAGSTLERSQQLLCSLLQDLKLTYLAQVNRAGIDALMDELDELTSPVAASPSSASPTSKTA